MVQISICCKLWKCLNTRNSRELRELWVTRFPARNYLFHVYTDNKSSSRKTPMYRYVYYSDNKKPVTIIPTNLIPDMFFSGKKTKELGRETTKINAIWKRVKIQFFFFFFNLFEYVEKVLLYIDESIDFTIIFYIRDIFW